MNINIADAIAKARALWAFINDPANGWYARLVAVYDFVTYVRQFLPDAGTVLFKAARKGMTPEQALAGLEALGARRGQAPTDEECCDCVLTFLVTIVPLDCCEP